MGIRRAPSTYAKSDVTVHQVYKCPPATGLMDCGGRCANKARGDHTISGPFVNKEAPTNSARIARGLGETFSP